MSIHTLAAAAYQLLDDLIAKQGGPEGFKDLFLKFVKPESQEAVRRKVNEAQNFFKHADRDHEEVLDFRPEATEIFLLDACERYFALTGEGIPSFDVFRAWFLIGGIGVTLALPAEQEKIRRLARQSFPNPRRQSFFAEMLPMASQLRAGAGALRA